MTSMTTCKKTDDRNNNNDIQITFENVVNKCALTHDGCWLYKENQEKSDKCKEAHKEPNWTFAKTYTESLREQIKIWQKDQYDIDIEYERERKKREKNQKNQNHGKLYRVTMGADRNMEKGAV